MSYWNPRLTSESRGDFVDVMRNLDRSVLIGGVIIVFYRVFDAMYKGPKSDSTLAILVGGGLTFFTAMRFIIGEELFLKEKTISRRYLTIYWFANRFRLIGMTTLMILGDAAIVAFPLFIVNRKLLLLWFGLLMLPDIVLQIFFFKVRDEVQLISYTAQLVIGVLGWLFYPECIGEKGYISILILATFFTLINIYFIDTREIYKFEEAL